MKRNSNAGISEQMKEIPSRATQCVVDLRVLTPSSLLSAIGRDVLLLVMVLRLDADANAICAGLRGTNAAVVVAWNALVVVLLEQTTSAVAARTRQTDLLVA